jgi:D-beta-D-heptose 7-phosphate kinase/D-beta-D-heptose 1-phosphate adenosyltransferase
MSAFKVVVFGDFMQDIYWIGDAARLSPEAPIPVVKIKETKSFPGGAGNVAENLEALGVDVVWFIGGVKPKKNRLMVGDYQLARWDENDACEPIGKLKDSLHGFDAIVVADYGKGAIDPYTISYIKSHKDIVPIFVDTKQNPSVWSGVATAVFPNAKESTEFGSYYNFDGLVVQKLGSQGICLYNDTNLMASCPAKARFVKSVNGAGDTVIAAFVYKWLSQGQEYAYYEEGRDYDELVDFASTAAAIAVEHPLTYAPTLKEIEERYYGNY